MDAKELPSRPSLEQYKKQAKDPPQRSKKPAMPMRCDVCGNTILVLRS